MSKRILITGICGFAGSHLCEHILKNTDWSIAGIDRLSYASSGFDRVRDINAYDDKRVNIFVHNLTLPINKDLKSEIGDLDFVVHLGAETHVDNSITDPIPFVMSNVLGTANLLQFARDCKNLKTFLYFSTDEVFGPAPLASVPDGYKEWDRYNSANPYAATKAGGEELCLAWANTYGVPVIITHTMNIFGERQNKEKFIPLCIRKILAGETIQIHADPTKTISGSRFWIHARNVAAAVLFLLRQEHISRDKFNIVGEKEVSNLEMALTIAKILGKDLNYEMQNFHESRPGHDLRYGLDGSKLRMMGFNFNSSFEDSIRKTIEWTLQNKRWLGL